MVLKFDIIVRSPRLDHESSTSAEPMKLELLHRSNQRRGSSSLTDRVLSRERSSCLRPRIVDRWLLLCMSASEDTSRSCPPRGADQFLKAELTKRPRRAASTSCRVHSLLGDHLLSCTRSSVPFLVVLLGRCVLQQPVPFSLLTSCLVPPFTSGGTISSR